MNTTENQVRNSARDESGAAARSQRVSAVAWLTVITAVVALGVMTETATVSIGMGLGIIGVTSMVAFVSYLLLKS
jgi:hypothetical protein